MVVAPGGVTHRPKKWILAAPPPPELQAALPDVHPLTVRLLYNRGLREPEDFRRFHEASFNDLHDPFLMPDMARAVERLHRVARQDELVAIYGDFDADGVTGSALLIRALEALGIRSRPYMPKRLEEGYGLHTSAIDLLASEGVRAIVTVDCGITSFAEVEEARRQGIDVIICDHHKLSDQLPQALAVLHPALGDYPFRHLCAAGVAFKLAQALLSAECQVPSAEEERGVTQHSALSTRHLTQLAAIGTLADMVPLTGENRLLVKYGLDQLRREPSFGLQAMLDLAGIERERVTCSDVSFVLAPHINASGRLDDAGLALRLMLCHEETEARELASRLRELNQERQRLTQEVLEQARAQVLAADPAQLAYVVAGEGWPPGVVGLVAGKLTEAFGRPVFAMELGAETCRGSARSVDGFDLVEAMSACRHLLSRFGGHARAAGFSLPRAAYDAFAAAITERASATLSAQDLEPVLIMDSELKTRHLNWDIYRLVQRLAPFGTGNATPIFLIKGLHALRPSAAGDHLRMAFARGRETIDAFAYGMGYCAQDIQKHPDIDVAFELSSSTFQGYETLELRVRDWRVSEARATRHEP